MRFDTDARIMHETATHGVDGKLGPNDRSLYTCRLGPSRASLVNIVKRELDVVHLACSRDRLSHLDSSTPLLLMIHG